MSASNATAANNVDYDAVIIGAGFAGLYQLYKLRDRLGLNVHLFEKGSGIGGTWFWNKYPGAMSDTESPFYRYSFDDDFLADWDWQRKYVDQPDILAYLEETVRRFDLGRNIELNTEVTGMVWSDDGHWSVRTADGRIVTSTYVVTALGLLSVTNLPAIPGLGDFKGRLVHTAEYPDDLDIAGKRVGIIGTGSTGCQFIVASAPVVEKLTVFQRSPQYSVPSGNGPVEEGEVDGFKARWGEILPQIRESAVAFGFKESTVPTMSVSAEERERVFQQAWDRGNGFYYMFGTFCDLATDSEANEAAAAFIRKKIKETVKDPATAGRLTPLTPYAKRPLCNHEYYEVYNRANVELVSIREDDTPIERVTARGVLTSDGQEHPLDVLVLATGFDAVDGNYRKLDLWGRQHINKHWDPAPTSYMGIMTAGFPNMFMVVGPNGPFVNIVAGIEVQVEFITTLVQAAEVRGKIVEATKEAEDAWTETCKTIAGMTLFAKEQSWIFGANIPGKRHSVLFYLGGLKNYRDCLETSARNGMQGFAFPNETTVRSKVEAAVSESKGGEMEHIEVAPAQVT
ncbi:hypothetical protein CspHIS471_0106180 [Cutaneotrichosporon sp. HIS471]|nr:hypothetical protein CspHIS471_0106180 [Cutaneotrichosporon sp. HIS471]